MGDVLQLTQKHNSKAIDPQFVADQIDMLAKKYVTDKVKTNVDAVDALAPLFRAIAAKCILCLADKNGRTSLDDLVNCADNACPLSDYGPYLYQAVQAIIERENND